MITLRFSFLHPAAMLLFSVLLPCAVRGQVYIHEKLEIHPKAPQQRRAAASNTQKVDSTSAIERLTAGFVLAQTSTSSSTSSAGPQIVLPNGGTATATIVGGASNAVLDLVLRSPESLTLFTNANSHHGESWMSPQYEPEPRSNSDFIGHTGVEAEANTGHFYSG